MKQLLAVFLILCISLPMLSLSATASFYEEYETGEYLIYNGEKYIILSDGVGKYFREDDKRIVIDELKLYLVHPVTPDEYRPDTPIDFYGVETLGWRYDGEYPGGHLYALFLTGTVHPYEAVDVISQHENVASVDVCVITTDVDLEDPTYTGNAGDINDNGVIDMTDYILIKRAYFGTYTLSGLEPARADINCNDIIDMTDYILTKRMYFGTWSPEKG